MCVLVVNRQCRKLASLSTSVSRVEVLRGFWTSEMRTPDLAFLPHLPSPKYHVLSCFDGFAPFIQLLNLQGRNQVSLAPQQPSQSPPPSMQSSSGPRRASTDACCPSLGMNECRKQAESCLPILADREGVCLSSLRGQPLSLWGSSASGGPLRGVFWGEAKC